MSPKAIRDFRTNISENVVCKIIVINLPAVAAGEFPNIPPALGAGAPNNPVAAGAGDPNRPPELVVAAGAPNRPPPALAVVAAGTPKSDVPVATEEVGAPNRPEMDDVLLFIANVEIDHTTTHNLNCHEILNVQIPCRQPL